MSLLIVGTAAAKLIEVYPDVISAHAGVPWRSMRGMRNRIVHDYVSIDLDIVLMSVLLKALDALE